MYDLLVIIGGGRDTSSLSSKWRERLICQPSFLCRLFQDHQTVDEGKSFLIRELKNYHFVILDKNRSGQQRTADAQIHQERGWWELSNGWTTLTIEHKHLTLETPLKWQWSCQVVGKQGRGPRRQRCSGGDVMRAMAVGELAVKHLMSWLYPQISFSAPEAGGCPSAVSAED